MDIVQVPLDESIMAWVGGLVVVQVGVRYSLAPLGWRVGSFNIIDQAFSAQCSQDSDSTPPFIVVKCPSYPFVVLQFAFPVLRYQTSLIKLRPRTVFL
jgi:hypothetical protein